MSWTVGSIKITRIVETETVGSTRFILPLATNEEIQKLPWLIPAFRDRRRPAQNVDPLAAGRNPVAPDHRRYRARQRQAGPQRADVEQPQGSVPRQADGGGLPARAHRYRAVHASACRPCRVEHPTGRRQVGADLHQCALRVRQDRIRALARPQRCAGQGSRVRRFRAADRRRRQGRSRRQRCQA